MKRSSGWESILQSAECRNVLARVAALRRRGERVYPIQKNVFRAFEDCSFKKVRVVILGQDPYANEGQAIGPSLCRAGIDRNATFAQEHL